MLKTDVGMVPKMLTTDSMKVMCSTDGETVRNRFIYTVVEYQNKKRRGSAKAM